jgi:two-component system chemotaxis sensor kinase CheA
MAVRDPYKYFRVEARELLDGLNQGALEIEKEGPNQDAVGRILRHAHTLKGASRVVRLGELADLAHAVEETVAPIRGGAASLPLGLMDRLLGILDRMGGRLAALDAPPQEGQKEAPAARPADRRLETVRLEVTELDMVLEGLRDAVGRLGSLRREAGALGKARRMVQWLLEPGASGLNPRGRATVLELGACLEGFDRLALGGMEQAERELLQTHERAARMRLLPASALFDYLQRTCRDAASTLGKRVRFESQGGEQRLDAPVLYAVQEALQHVVRNAVVHGIEGPQERLAKGKNPEGLIRVSARRLGGSIVFSCSDDGGGVDLEKVGRAAMKKGQRAQASKLEMREALDLLLQGGLSSSAEVSELAGRGLGLNILRETVKSLKGELRLDSPPGKGLELELRVPYSLSSFPALEVESSGVVCLVPLDGVQRVLGLHPGLLGSSAEGPLMHLDGSALPFLPLAECLGLPRAGASQDAAGLVLKTSLGPTALGVERIVGLHEAVMLPMPALAPHSRLACGACLDAAGNPRLVLDPEGMASLARSHRTRAEAGPKAAALPLLVVDDSLTTRMLEQSILETAGYEVSLASSAEEGLAMARERPYGLILVDVEMPGMDGFEFLRCMRDDPALRATPAILISSRSSDEDFRRGELAGARDYIVKGEFDQARLLKRIRELLG